MFFVIKRIGGQWTLIVDGERLYPNNFSHCFIMIQERSLR